MPVWAQSLHSRKEAEDAYVAAPWSRGGQSRGLATEASSLWLTCLPTAYLLLVCLQTTFHLLMAQTKGPHGM